MEEISSMWFATVGGFTEEPPPHGGHKNRESYEWAVRGSSDHGYVLRIDKRVFDEHGMELGRFTVEIALPGSWTRPSEED